MRNIKGCMGIALVIAVIIGFIVMAAKGCEGASVSSTTKDGAYFQRKELNDRNMGVKKQQNSNTPDEYYYEKVRCHKCYGLGTLSDFTDPNHITSQKCPVCNGTGYVIEKRSYQE